MSTAPKFRSSNDTPSVKPSAAPSPRTGAPSPQVSMDAKLLAQDLKTIRTALHSDDPNAIGYSLSDAEIRSVERMMGTKNPKLVASIKGFVANEDVAGLKSMVARFEARAAQAQSAPVVVPGVVSVAAAPVEREQPDWKQMSFGEKIRDAVKFELPAKHTLGKEINMLTTGDENTKVKVDLRKMTEKIIMGAEQVVTGFVRVPIGAMEEVISFSKNFGKYSN